MSPVEAPVRSGSSTVSSGLKLVFRVAAVIRSTGALRTDAEGRWSHQTRTLHTEHRALLKMSFKSNRTTVRGQRDKYNMEDEPLFVNLNIKLLLFLALMLGWCRWRLGGLSPVHSG